jgi:hypothetical protein
MFRDMRANLSQREWDFDLSGRGRGCKPACPGCQSAPDFGQQLGDKKICIPILTVATIASSD